MKTLAPPPSGQPIVLNYIRFSTAEQADGDSERRQTTMANAWAKEKGMIIDDSWRFFDRGISAYKGKNESEELGRLLALATSGKIPRGSYLLVENLDRLSRQDPLAGVGLLKSLLSPGLRVITLTDGTEYVEGKIGLEALMSFFKAGIDFYRGHGESERKSGALKESWEGKRLVASTKAMTTLCPAWMRPIEGGFELIPERARIIQRIFTEFVKGKGVYAIAHGLRLEKVPPWGKLKKNSGSRARVWHKTYIRKILSNPAVVGEGQPYKIDKTVPGHRVPVGDPIDGYYPRAVSAELWQAAEARWRAITADKRSPRGPRGGANSITSLFSGLLTCGRTAGTIAIQRKGSSGPQSKPRLYSVEAPGRYTSWLYDDFESHVLGQILGTEAAEIWPAQNAAAERDDLQTQLADAREHLAATAKMVERLVSLIEKEDDNVEVLSERLSSRNREKKALMEKINAMQLRLDKLNNEAAKAEDSIGAVRNLFGRRRDPAFRDALRSHVRDLVAHIEVYCCPAPRPRELRVMKMAQTARKLLKLAAKRRGQKSLSVGTYKFRLNDKKLCQALWLVERMPLRQYAVITFASGVSISTKRMVPGLAFNSSGVTMLEGDSKQIKGYMGIYAPKIGFLKSLVPFGTMDTQPHPEAVAELEAFFKTSEDDSAPTSTFEVVSPKKKERFPGT
ncbi:hypothetical protein BH09VER1_BH09VER1_16070 [soil metagenome]